MLYKVRKQCCVYNTFVEENLYTGLMFWLLFLFGKSNVVYVALIYTFPMCTTHAQFSRHIHMLRMKGRQQRESVHVEKTAYIRACRYHYYNIQLYMYMYTVHYWIRQYI